MNKPMNLISQHIQEENKLFDEKFVIRARDVMWKDGKEVLSDYKTNLKDFLRSSSLSLVEKIIGQVRGMKNTDEMLEMDGTKYTKGFEHALESIALLLEQGLNEVKNNK